MTTDEAARATAPASIVTALNARLQALRRRRRWACGRSTGGGSRSESQHRTIWRSRGRAAPIGGAQSPALDAQSASGGIAVSFPYAAAAGLRRRVDGFRDGQTNSVLVITAGPAHRPEHSTDRGWWITSRARRTRLKPVAVNVIDFGTDPDRATWESVAQMAAVSTRTWPTRPARSWRPRWPHY